jgi:ribosomal protein S18 acetylase RimI-like enzyme
VGFLSARSAGDQVELLDVATEPAFRRQGVAQALVRSLAERAARVGSSSIHLEVRESNLGAIALYAKLGFETMRQRVGYYQDPPENALCMTRSLEPDRSGT